MNVIDEKWNCLLINWMTTAWKWTDEEAQEKKFYANFHLFKRTRSIHHHHQYLFLRHDTKEKFNKKEIIHFLGFLFCHTYLKKKKESVQAWKSKGKKTYSHYPLFLTSTIEWVKFICNSFPSSASFSSFLLEWTVRRVKLFYFSFLHSSSLMLFLLLILRCYSENSFLFLSSEIVEELTLIYWTASCSIRRF